MQDEARDIFAEIDAALADSGAPSLIDAQRLISDGGSWRFVCACGTKIAVKTKGDALVHFVGQHANDPAKVEARAAKHLGTCVLYCVSSCLYSNFVAVLSCRGHSEGIATSDV